MPRKTKPVSRRTDTAVLVRCTSLEKAELKEAAQAEHRSLANFLLNAGLERSKATTDKHW